MHSWGSITIFEVRATFWAIPRMAKEKEVERAISTMKEMQRDLERQLKTRDEELDRHEAQKK